MASRMLPSPRRAPVLGQRTAGLPHEPHRHPLGRQAAGGPQQGRVGRRRAGRRPSAQPTVAPVRRSIDDHPFTADELAPSDDDIQHLSWAVAISDDYDDAEPRVVLTVEEVGRAWRRPHRPPHPDHRPTAPRRPARRPPGDRRGRGVVAARMGDMLGRHLAERYGVSADAPRELEPGGGVFHVADPGWIARVFPADRPVAAAEHDARVLALLESADLPAERLASDEPVSVLDDGRAVLVTRFVPGRQCRDAREPELLSTGRRHPGAGARTARAERPAPRRRVAPRRRPTSAPAPTTSPPSCPASRTTRLRAAVEAIDTGEDLPEALVHPDPCRCQRHRRPVRGPGAHRLDRSRTRQRGCSPCRAAGGAAIDTPELASRSRQASRRHVDLTDEERDRLLRGSLLRLPAPRGGEDARRPGDSREPLVDRAADADERRADRWRPA